MSSGEESEERRIVVRSAKRGQSSSGDAIEGGQSSLFFTELRKMNESFTSSIKAVSDRLDQLSEKVNGPPPNKKRLTEVGSHWGDRRDSVLDLPSGRLEWPDSDLEGDDGEEYQDDPEFDRQRDTPKEPLALSEEDSAIMKVAFSKPLSNKDRVAVRNAFPPPAIPQTRCPKLDPIFKTAAASKAEVKATDTELARLQAFVLDPAAPLFHLLAEIDNQGSDVSIADVRHVISEALRLVGNASSQISQTRRKRIIKALNPDLQDLASEDTLFAEAGSSLFGQGFEKRMKERAESVQLLSKAKSSQDRSQFFRKGRPTAPSRGGGYSSHRGGKNFAGKKSQKTK